MPRPPKQSARLKEVEALAKRYGLADGLFNPPGSKTGHSPEDLAISLWEMGYIVVPTVMALMDALEKNLEDIHRKQLTNQLSLPF